MARLTTYMCKDVKTMLAKAFFFTLLCILSNKMYFMAFLFEVFCKFT